ncbi:MAG: hypothetical protein IKF91_05340 [Bacilli bacterium]|nr:hypothetical protein [Bacilli bacterium]
MKNKFIKKLYIFLVFVSIMLFIFLIIHPLKHQVQSLYFNTSNKIYYKSYLESIEYNFFVKNDNTFRYIIFLNNDTTYTNLNLCLYDSNNNVIMNQTIEKYKANIMLFEFEPIKSGKYRLVIKDLDGDSIDIAVTKKSKYNYIDGDNNALKFVTYYREPYYFYIWYPIFVWTFLFTIYPFVWNGDKNEK